MPEQPKIQFTPAQAAAISARGGSLLVSAAAGSGKTRVLVERVVGLITDPVHPVDANQLLIMTFTNAAAAKLGRIRDHLDGLLIDMAKNLYSGRIDAEPLCTGGRSPCTYCEFRCACTHRDGEHERTINIKDDPFAE